MALAKGTSLLHEYTYQGCEYARLHTVMQCLHSDDLCDGRVVQVQYHICNSLVYHLLEYMPPLSQSELVTTSAQVYLKDNGFNVFLVRLP